ncbi:unnamed protein product [Parnassius apollo]|uniref:(apollo) hypothetical protein n=1 Tax=Parnassius apollo TaxID=110799 RepID=A0A8S3WX53_PARAO|nr:unnamed protein product [Parnassius apollo]
MGKRKSCDNLEKIKKVIKKLEKKLRKKENLEGFKESTPPLVYLLRRIAIAESLKENTIEEIPIDGQTTASGNINTREIVEKLSDTLRITAEIFYEDSAARKYFDLSGAKLVLTEAVKNTMTDEFFRTDQNSTDYPKSRSSDKSSGKE